MATLSAAFHRKSANPSAPQRPTTPTKITVAPLIHPAFPFQNHQATQRLALNPHSPTPPPAHTTPRFPPSRLFGRLPPCIRSRPRTAGIRKPLTEEEFITAYGDAMREEYQAILDAGLILQIDFPMLVSRWDTASRTMSLADYRKWAEGRIAYLSYALRGLPEDRIRFHTCYGVNFGPRVSDLQLENILDLIFTIPAGAYSFEAANPRHEHEWRVLERIKLPDGKLLIPGAVTPSNVMIEHPETIADRIERWARVAGRENVIFGNDCGFQSTAGNSEIPVTVAWAKLQALGEGARIASARLWH